MKFRDIIYKNRDRIARITINRLKKLNAYTLITLYKFSRAFIDTFTGRSIGVVVFTGSGDKAFCVDGNQSYMGYATGELEGTIAALPLEVGWQIVTFPMRHIPKPVIARVGYTIGGRHVLQVNCDLSIASEKAKFGQARPRVESFDPGFGTGDLWRNVGLKKAKEIWYLCRIYSAEEALKMGLVNAVVPHEKLDEEVEHWCELLEKSSTTLKMLKYTFLADIDGLAGITELEVGVQSLCGAGGSIEGRNAFLEKREPNFWKFLDEKRGG